jgi:hypothetical protein
MAIINSERYNGMNGQITEFIRHHYRHFNAAALTEAEGWKNHLNTGGKMMVGFLALILVASAMAQERPDFSGRWAVEPEPTPAPAAPGAPARPRVGNMGSGWGATISIKQTADKLTLEYDFFARGDMQAPLKFAYALDGSETSNSVMMGRGIQIQVSKAAWEGKELLLTTTHTVEDPAGGKPSKMDVKRKLWLESPETLVVETTRDGALGGAATTTRTVYKKT